MNSNIPPPLSAETNGLDFSGKSFTKMRLILMIKIKVTGRMGRTGYLHVLIVGIKNNTLLER